MATTKKSTGATARTKAMAKKYGIKLTRLVGGKRIAKTEAMLKKQIETAKKKAAKATTKKATTKKATAKKSTAKKSTARKKMTATQKLAKKMKQTGGASDTKADKRLEAKEPGYRRSKKYSTIKTKSGKTIRRRNANQTGPVDGGKLYSETRANRTDKNPKRRY